MQRAASPTTPHDVLKTEEIESILRTIPRNKAVGLDGIPGEALRALPQQDDSVCVG